MPLLAANWKMNTTTAEAIELVTAMKEQLHSIAGVEKVLCPPYISLTTVKDLIRGTSIVLGAQNMHFEEKGAYTGEISPRMLTGLCEYVILGHSERRHIFGETDEMVNRKVATALKVGLKPILCVGETLEEYEKGKTGEVVSRQLKAALKGISAPHGLVIAYEPVWAIGTGRGAEPRGAGATIGLIRRVLAQLYGDEVSQSIRVLYGGSVDTGNVAGFLREPEIDGALVGGASLRPNDFVSIVEQAARIKGKQ